MPLHVRHPDRSGSGSDGSGLGEEEAQRRTVMLMEAYKILKSAH